MLRKERKIATEGTESTEENIVKRKEGKELTANSGIFNDLQIGGMGLFWSNFD